MKARWNWIRLGGRVAEPRYDLFQRAAVSKAEAHYRKALEADPKYALAQFNIANLYDERGDYERALRHYRRRCVCIPDTRRALQSRSSLSGQRPSDGSRPPLEDVSQAGPQQFLGSDARRELDKLRRYTVVSGRRTGALERQMLE